MAAPAHKEGTKKNSTLRDFRGVNTQAARQVIGDDEFAWLEGCMPVGFGNLRTLPAANSALATLSATCYYMAPGSIAATDYMYMFCTDGSCVQVTLSNGTKTTVGAAGTFSGAGTRMCQWKNERMLIIDPSKGYHDWDGATLTATSVTNGTDISSYSGRVWICNNRTVVFSAPNSYTDFTTLNYGGSFILTDETMHSSIQRLYAANGYLYIFGVDSINVVSGVTVNTTLAATVFSNSNVTAGNGTYMPDSVSVYYRTLMFASSYGMFSLSGVTPAKISDNLDGMFPYIQQSQLISCGAAVIYNIMCLCFLAKYADPTTGTNRQLLLCLHKKEWFFASPLANITFVAQGGSSGIPALYAMDGTNLYKLFANTTSNVSQTIKTKLWDMGSPLITKQALKFGIEMSVPTVASISVGIDTENAGRNYVTPVAVTNGITWLNNSGVVITWTNNLSQTITWSAGGYTFIRGDAQNVGNYLGLTITNTTAQTVYEGFHLQYEARTPWTGTPF
jgi:hypothetical protein